MKMTVTPSFSHSCLVGLSKPVVFTGASAMFLMVYVALWKFHDHSGNGTATFTSALEQMYHNNDVFDPQGFEEMKYCNLDAQDEFVSTSKKKPLIPVIYFVTPTYSRPVQIAELTRLGQTLSSVPALHWVLVEDSDHCSPVIASLLKRLGIPFTHLATQMPAIYRKQQIQPRGVSNRRVALHWIRNNIQQGVLYFGDDDNTYDLRLFDEIRDTRQISMFPVGLIGDYSVSAPVVHDGKVVGFYDSWPAGRRYAVDMAGFAVNIRLLHQHPNATIIYKAGYEEDYFLQGLSLDDHQIEAKAANCTQILVWHTRTTQVPSASLRPPSDANKLTDTSIPGLFQTLGELNLATFSNKGKRSSVHYLNSV